MTKNEVQKTDPSRLFADLDLDPSILRAVEEQGYAEMTPIQQKGIPAIQQGKDLIGIAQTGTGKTAAFSLPIIHKIISEHQEYVGKTTRALILAPTRELAVQIAENVRKYAEHVSLRTTLVYGGASAKPQIKALSRGVDIVVATPGRLLDLFSDDYIWLGKVDYFVLDEADRMLDMGFIHDIRKIVAQLPKKRQTLLFSATMAKEVEKLAAGILKDPVRINIAPSATTAEKVSQTVLMVSKDNKRPLLQHLLKDQKMERVLVFTRTKHGANRLTRFLEKLNIDCSAIHGNKSQNTRQKALESFKNGDIRVLVATDVAARGIDVDNVTHVINYDVPNDADNYVHRIGRTARAGMTGISITFCDHDELDYLKAIEKITKQSIPQSTDQPFHADHSSTANSSPAKSSKPKNQRSRSRRPENGRSNGGNNTTRRPNRHKPRAT
ncbi:DEAD/DEAH box helicase [Sneathiella sp.]|jgi:ATP-dependent RNA helicase RhlE|uniref:DEAD/DEAH box helicase n=1 Tax=Sneathiella sp. TaxID=1964365 RepID=UPI0039E36C60